MKKLAVLILILIAAAPAMADCVATQYSAAADFSTLVFKLECTAAANGSVAALQIATTDVTTVMPKNYTAMGYYLWGVWTVAGTTAPDAADIAITDEKGATLFSEVGCVTATGTKECSVTKPPKQINSKITVTHTNQATNGALWTTYIELAK